VQISLGFLEYFLALLIEAKMKDAAYSVLLGYSISNHFHYKATLFLKFMNSIHDFAKS